MEELKKDTSYRFLVLMDFSESSYHALKYAVSLSKLFPVHIQLFHVVTAIEKDDYQLNLQKMVIPKVEKAMKKLDAIVDIISADGISVSYEFSFGNLLIELESQLKKCKPDLVVVPKRNLENKVSKKILNFFVNKYSGSFLVVGKELEFSGNTKMAIAFSSKNFKNYDWNTVFEINKHTENELRLLHVLKSGTVNPDYLQGSWKKFLKNETDVELNLVNNKSISTGVLDSIKEKEIEFVGIGRGHPSSSLFNLGLSKKGIVSNVINKLDIPVFVLGKQGSLKI